MTFLGRTDDELHVYAYMACTDSRRTSGRVLVHQHATSFSRIYDLGLSGRRLARFDPRGGGRGGGASATLQ